MFSNLNDVKKFIKANDVKMIDFKMTDIDGRWRHILIPQQRLDEDTVVYGSGCNI